MSSYVIINNTIHLSLILLLLLLFLLCHIHLHLKLDSLYFTYVACFHSFIIFCYLWSIALTFSFFGITFIILSSSLINLLLLLFFGYVKTRTSQESFFLYLWSWHTSELVKRFDQNKLSTDIRFYHTQEFVSSEKMPRQFNNTKRIICIFH